MQRIYLPLVTWALSARGRKKLKCFFFLARIWNYFVFPNVTIVRWVFVCLYRMLCITHQRAKRKINLWHNNIEVWTDQVSHTPHKAKIMAKSEMLKEPCLLAATRLTMEWTRLNFDSMLFMFSFFLFAFYPSKNIEQTFCAKLHKNTILINIISQFYRFQILSHTDNWRKMMSLTVQYQR